MRNEQDDTRVGGDAQSDQLLTASGNEVTRTFDGENWPALLKQADALRRAIGRLKYRGGDADAVNREIAEAFVFVNDVTVRTLNRIAHGGIYGGAWCQAVARQTLGLAQADDAVARTDGTSKG